MLESKDSGSFNLGIGNGDAFVKPIIAPFYKVSENSALIFVDNKFINVSEDADPTQVSAEDAKEFPDFFETCEAIGTVVVFWFTSSIAACTCVATKPEDPFE